MEQRISRYSISLIALLWFILAPASAQMQNGGMGQGQQAQQPVKVKEKTPPEVEWPLYNGTYIGVDIWGPASKAMGNDFLSMEATAIVNLKNRYFPTAEVGYGSTDMWDEDLGVHYKTAAPFIRLGADYNVLWKKKHANLLLVGLRYGMSSFSYDIDSPGMDDNIYGGSTGSPNLQDEIWHEGIPYQHNGMKSTMHWAELCFGLRAHISKNIYMGWSLRMKYKISASTGTYGDPYYVPGYGKYGTNNMGISYSIIYKIPVK